LIEALSKDESRKELLFHIPKFGRGLHRGFDVMPDVVSRTVKRAVQTGFEERMGEKEMKFRLKAKWQSTACPVISKPPVGIRMKLSSNRAVLTRRTRRRIGSN